MADSLALGGGEHLAAGAGSALAQAAVPLASGRCCLSCGLYAQRDGLSKLGLKYKGTLKNSSGNLM